LRTIVEWPRVIFSSTVNLLISVGLSTNTFFRVFRVALGWSTAGKENKNKIKIKIYLVIEIILCNIVKVNFYIFKIGGLEITCFIIFFNKKFI
jgi:hypothetical protein